MMESEPPVQEGTVAPLPQEAGMPGMPPGAAAHVAAARVRWENPAGVAPGACIICNQ